MIHHRRTLLACLLLWLTGCATLPQPVIEPPAVSLSAQPLLAEQGLPDGTRYQLETAKLIIKTYRGGWLSRLSHGHVMTTSKVVGEILLTHAGAGSRAMLGFRPWDLELDDPEVRRAAGPGFESTRTPADIAATRTRMLGPRGFDSNTHPLVVVEASWLTATSAALEIEFRGERYEREVVIDWSEEADRIVASSSFTLDHADLGLKPYSAFAGAIAVARQIDVAIELRARRKE